MEAQLIITLRRVVTELATGRKNLRQVDFSVWLVRRENAHEGLVGCEVRIGELVLAQNTIRLSNTDDAAVEAARKDACQQMLQTLVAWGLFGRTNLFDFARQHPSESLFNHDKAEKIGYTILHHP